MSGIKIYTTSTCPFCRAAKEFFKANNIAYEEHDVVVDEKARNEMMEKSKQMGVPVIDINGKIFVGFGPSTKEQIKKELNIK